MGANLYIFIKVPDFICIHTKLEMGPAQCETLIWACKILKVNQAKHCETGKREGDQLPLLSTCWVFYTLMTYFNIFILKPLHFNILSALSFFLSNKLSTHTKRILKNFPTQLSDTSFATVKVRIRVYSCW